MVAAYRSETCGYEIAEGGGDLVGVYLRGSLPRGLFIPGVSDVDTFALVIVDGGGSSGGDGAASSGGRSGREGGSAPSGESSGGDKRCCGRTRAELMQAAVAAALGPVLERERERLGFVKVRQSGTSVGFCGEVSVCVRGVHVCTAFLIAV